MGFPYFGVLVHMLLLRRHLAQTAATTVALENTMWLLSASEELHRTFEVDRDRNVAFATILTSADGKEELCVRQLPPGTLGISRKRYEEAWTTAYNKGDLSLEAVLRLDQAGPCFSRVPGKCEPVFEKCSAARMSARGGSFEAYPDRQDDEGVLRLAPHEDALEGLRFSSRVATLGARQREQLDLLAKLQGIDPSDTDNEAVLMDAIRATYEPANQDLRADAKFSLAALTLERAKRFTAKLHTGGTLMPIAGSAMLPDIMLQTVGKVVTLVNAAITYDCAANSEFAFLRGQVLAQLDVPHVAINGINASALPTDSKKFDYARRATESLTVSAALALQASVVSALVEFQCKVSSDPRNAAASLEAFGAASIRDAVAALLASLAAALRAPAASEAVLSSVGRCMEQRVNNVGAFLAGMEANGQVPRLLGVDFCARLFETSSTRLVLAAPRSGTETWLSSADLQPRLNPKETRKLFADATGRLSLVSPYASIVKRTDGHGHSMFALNGWVIQLSADAQDTSKGNIRAAGPLTEFTWCTNTVMTAYRDMYPSTCVEDSKNRATCASGCRLHGPTCEKAAVGTYTVDGQVSNCDPVSCTSGVEVCSEFVAEGWPNKTCPFLCQMADEVPSGQSCDKIPSVEGYFSSTCNNSMLQCGAPEGVPKDLFLPMARFTSNGLGSSDGCEITMAFPVTVSQQSLALPTAAAAQPPFTVELWTKVDIREMPSPPISQPDRPAIAVLAGAFPRWYIAVRRAEDDDAQLCFYHADITLSSDSKGTSLSCSQAVPWTADWHHLAAMVDSKSSDKPNLHFFIGGVLVSSARVAASSAPEPTVHSDQRGVFHIGPPNMLLFPDVLQAGRTEPYYPADNATVFFRAQVDGVQMINAALQGITSGSLITEHRRSVVCDAPPFERLVDASQVCAAAPTLAGSHVSQDQTSCDAGYEPCDAQPGLCFPKCQTGTLRQPDCSCNCPSDKFQTWLVKEIILRGVGTLSSVKIYGRNLTVLEPSVAPKDMNLDLSFRFSTGTQVAMVAVRGGGSATTISLSVVTPAGATLRIPAHQSVKLIADRDIYLHHERPDDIYDASMKCTECLGQGLGSTLPRSNIFKCHCGKGYGRDLLGVCQPLLAALPAPTISPPSGLYSPGTRIELQPPQAEVVGPWLLEVRYTVGLLGATPDPPSCSTSQLYDSARGIRLPGCAEDTMCLVIRRKETAKIRAILCHPAHHSSPISEGEYTGKDQLNPPTCNVTGIRTRANTFERKASLALIADREDPTVYFQRSGDASTLKYSAPIELSATSDPFHFEGLKAWAESENFERSLDTNCESFWIDAAARLDVSYSWQDGSEQLLTAAQVVHRGVTKLHMKLAAQLANGSRPQGNIDIRVCNKHRKECGAIVWDWPPVLANGSYMLDMSDIVSAKQTAEIELVWRARETGRVWTDAGGIKLLVVASKASKVDITGNNNLKPLKQWMIGDDWTSGALRTNALTQVHKVRMSPPSSGARILFVFGEWSGSDGQAPVPLVVCEGSGLVDNFVSVLPPPEWSPQELSQNCAAPVAGSVGKPGLCQYLEPILVLGGATVTAFALEGGKLESLATTISIPKEKVPPRGDSAFQVDISIASAQASIPSAGFSVIPSTVSDLALTLGRPDVERQFCVLVSRFVQDDGSAKSSRTFEDCAWQTYIDASAPYSWAATLLAGSNNLSTDVSMNVTVLASAKLPGYLWAYPSNASFVWLWEPAAKPSIFGVGEQEAMVWVPQVSAAKPAHCYFTLHTMTLTATEYPAVRLNVVPDGSAVYPSLMDVVRAADLRLKAVQHAAWSNDLSKCRWDLAATTRTVCEMPVGEDGISATFLPATPLLPFACFWTVWPDRLESQPACAPLASFNVAKRILRVEGAERPFEPLVGVPADMTVDEHIGRDDLTGGLVIRLGTKMDERRLSSQSAGRALSRSSLARDLALFFDAKSPLRRLILERSHPLRYRVKTLAVEAEVLGPNYTATFSTSLYSQAWQVLPKLGPLPKVNLTSEPGRHTMVVVDVSLRDTEAWSTLSSRSYSVVLGKHAAPQAEAGPNRTVSLSRLGLGSTVVYRWLSGDADSAGGRSGSDFFVKSFVRECWNVRTCLPEVGANIIAAGARIIRPTIDGCVEIRYGDGTPSSLALNASVSLPNLCALGTESSQVFLEPPTGQRWIFWAAASAPGLALSEPTMVVIGAQCTLQMDSTSLGAPFCAEGSLTLDSGSSCTPQCLPGYMASATEITCENGRLSLDTFHCQEEAPCAVPTKIGNATLESPCAGAEGGVIASGSLCAARCIAGFQPTVVFLSCVRGELSPSRFACEPVVAESVSTLGLIAGSFSGVVVAFVVAIVLCVMRRQLAPAPPEEEEKLDDLEEWLACVHEVMPGICVFCGMNPATVENSDEQHGPRTLFRSCTMCAELLCACMGGDAIEDVPGPLVKEQAASVEAKAETAAWLRDPSVTEPAGPVEGETASLLRDVAAHEEASTTAPSRTAARKGPAKRRPRRESSQATDAPAERTPPLAALGTSTASSLSVGPRQEPQQDEEQPSRRPTRARSSKAARREGLSMRTECSPSH